MAAALTIGATGSAATSASVATFTAFGIGAADPDRVVLVCLTAEINATFSACTVNGVAAQLLGQATDTAPATDVTTAIYRLRVPNGTTANITATLTTGNTTVGLTTVRMVGGSQGAIDTDQAVGSGPTISIAALTIPTDGGAVYSFANAGQGTAVAWTNAVELSDAAQGGIHRHSVAVRTVAGTFTTTADGANAGQALIGFAFLPSAVLAPGLVSDPDTFYTPIVTRGARTLSSSLVDEPDDIYSTTVVHLADEIRAVVSWLHIHAATTETHLLQPSLYSDADSFFAPTITGQRTFTAPRLNDPDTIYATTVLKLNTIGTQLYSDADTFYAPSIARGARTLSPARYDDADTFFGVVVVSGVGFIYPDPYIDADTFFIPEILRGARTLTAARYDDTDTIFAARVQRELGASLYSDADIFYAPSVARGALTLVPARYDDPDTFYAASTAGAEVSIGPALYSDPDSFFAPSVGRSIKPALYDDTDTFYAPAVTSGEISISAALYSDPDALYTTSISAQGQLFPGARHDDPDNLYAPSIIAGAIVLSPQRHDDPDVVYTTIIGRQRVGTGIGNVRAPAAEAVGSRAGTPAVGRVATPGINRATPSVSRKAA